MGVFGHGENKSAHGTETPDVRHLTNPDVMHEESDVSVRGVATFVGALFVFGVVVCALVFGTFILLEKREEYDEARHPPMPLMRAGAERLPPENMPHLQGAPGHGKPDRNFELKEPMAEWEALRDVYEHDLNTSSAAPDPVTGTMRIPIADAERMLLQKGVTTRPEQPGTPSVPGGMDMPSYFSNATQMEKRDQ